MYDERAVANFLLDEAEKLNVRLTHLSLQKLIFFAHAWHLATYDAPLVHGQFQAWKFGPVLRSVFDAFRGCGKRPIDIRATKLDLASGAFIVCHQAFDSQVRDLLLAVLGAGAHLPPWYLSQLTHRPDSPWERVWSQARDQVNVGMKIPNALIRSYFLRPNPPLPRG